MALIKTIEELKEFLRIPSTNITNKMPSIEVAEEQYLIPILGYELYNRLSEAYEADALSPGLQQLLSRSRSIIAPLAYLLGLPFLQVNLSDQGATAMESQNTRKAFKWEYNEIKEALTNSGFSAMEKLIIYLKEHSIEFPEWQTAPYNSAELTFIIRDGNDLKKAVAIDQPHRCFLLLQPMLPSLVELQIIPVISEAFFMHFNERIISGNLSDVERKLNDLLRQAMARLLMKQAGIEMSIKFSGSGFTIVDVLKDRPEEGRTDPGDKRLQRWCMEMERTGNAYLNAAKEHLIKNAEDPAFSIFKSSDAFPTEVTTPSGNDNCKRKGIFIA
jgi:hypothetical protein